jgi:hypothetical protein
MALTLRQTIATGATNKGSELTYSELDANFVHLLESSNHNFTQSGTGAVAEDMQTVGRRFKFTSQYGTFAQALTAAAGGTLFVDSTVAISADVTVPATVTLHQWGSGKLQIADGATVRIYKQPRGPRALFFDIVGTDADPANWGDVTFSDSDTSPTTPYAHTVTLYPEWFGVTQATAVTSADSKEALRKCFRSYKPITQSFAQYRAVVEFLGDYVTSGTIYCHNNYSIKGVGGVKSSITTDNSSAAFKTIRYGGYLANGTTQTVDSGSFYPTFECSSIWFHSSGSNYQGTGAGNIALVEEAGEDNVSFSALIKNCWFTQTLRGIDYQRQVGDTVVENCWFDSTCLESAVLQWTSTSSRPIAGGVTFKGCSFLPVTYAIQFQYWSQLIVDSCKFYLGTNAGAKAFRCDGRSGSVQVSNSLFTTTSGNVGNAQYAFYTAARIDDLAVDNCQFENITNVLYKDGASAIVFGTFSNCRMANILKLAFEEQTNAKNSQGHIRVIGCNALGMLDRFADLTSRADFKDNEFLSVTSQPPIGSATTGGTFTLTFGGQTTGNIAYNASTTDVKDALELLSTIDTVTVTGSAGSYVVEFTGTHANTNVSMMTGSAANLTPTSVIRIYKSVISNGSNNTKQVVEYAQGPASTTELAAIVLRGAAAGGASGSRCEGNNQRTAGWLVASYRQSALGQADLTGIISANNRAHFSASLLWEFTSVNVECTRSRISNEGAIIEAWDNIFDDVTTQSLLTTGNTATALFAGTLYHENSHVAISAMVAARDQADPSVENALYRVDGAIKLEAGASTLLNNTTTVIYENTGTMDAALVDSTGGDIELKVTGVAATNIRWVAKLNTIVQ